MCVCEREREREREREKRKEKKSGWMGGWVGERSVCTWTVFILPEREEKTLGISPFVP